MFGERIHSSVDSEAPHPSVLVTLYQFEAASSALLLSKEKTLPEWETSPETMGSWYKYLVSVDCAVRRDTMRLEREENQTYILKGISPIIYSPRAR